MNRSSYLEAGYREIQNLPIGQLCLHNCTQSKVIDGYRLERCDGRIVDMAADSLVLPLYF